ncbi:hypothetical protein [Ensifer canadensis]
MQKQPKFTYEKLAVDRELRAELFASIAELKALAIRHGFFEAAKIHGMNAKRLEAEFAHFD